MKFDAIIIGFGKAGKTLAGFLAKKGEKVALIERSEKMYGGTCINIGCIPTKTLVHSAHLARRDVSWKEKQEYFRAAMEQKDAVVSFLREKNYEKLADDPNVTIFLGVGSFAGKNAVEVRGKDLAVTLEAPKIFINTGSETVIPDLPGVTDNPRVFTSTTLLDLKDLPQRLTIVGGGYIGLEFASMFASFGTQVTVLEKGPQVLPREDRDIAAAVQGILEKKGVQFKTHVNVTQIDGGTVVYEDRAAQKEVRLEGDAVLLAAGRRPNTEALALEKAGVEVNARGAIVVDEHLRTTNPQVYALGDVKGGPLFTYISLDDFRIVCSSLYGTGDRRISDRDPVSSTVFIDPPLAHIGLTAEEAQSLGRHIKVNTLPVAAIPRARTLNQGEGLFKIVVDADTQEILGCTLFGPEAGEVINTVAVAMKTGQKYTFLRDFIFTHPSMSEALNDLANF